MHISNNRELYLENSLSNPGGFHRIHLVVQGLDYLRAKKENMRLRRVMNCQEVGSNTETDQRKSVAHNNTILFRASCSI